MIGYVLMNIDVILQNFFSQKVLNLTQELVKQIFVLVMLAAINKLTNKNIVYGLIPMEM